MGGGFWEKSKLVWKKNGIPFFLIFFFSIYLDPISSHLLMIMKEEIFWIKTEV